MKKQFNIQFVILDKDTKKRIVQTTWIVTEETYNEVLDLLEHKQSLNLIHV